MEEVVQITLNKNPKTQNQTPTEMLYNEYTMSSRLQLDVRNLSLGCAIW